MPLFRAPARRALAVAASLSLAMPVSIARAQDTTARAEHNVDVHGFVQVYYRAGDPTVKDGYRLRKADLKFSGDISPHVRWRVGFDAAKVLTLSKSEVAVGDSEALSDASVDQRTRILQDAALTVTVNKFLSLDVGQQIVPLSLEGTISTAYVETIERTLFITERSRAVGLGDVRDIGASANGSVPFGLEYHVGLFNETGESQGTTDANDQKALIGRVVYHVPSIPGLQLGGSGAFEGGPFEQRRERAGSEIQFKNSVLTLRTESMAARDGGLHRFGWYGLGAWRVTSNLQLVSRYDAWDRDRSAETSTFDAYERQVTAGTSYLLDGGNAKIALNIVHQTFPNIASSANGTFALIAFQGLW
jgi:hypothetical protein